MLNHVTMRLPKNTLAALCVGYCWILLVYLGADRSLARPDLKNNWKVTIFLPTRRSLLLRRPGWTDNLLNRFWVACKKLEFGRC